MLGIKVRFEGRRISKVTVVEKSQAARAPALQPRQTVVCIDSRYSRPTEVDTLLGNVAKAQHKLG